jgi:hypothetical protein
MADLYRRKVSNLAAALSAPDIRAEAAELQRGIVERIELQPAGKGYEILLRGDLAGILTVASDSKKPAALSTGFCKWRWLRGHATTDTDTPCKLLYSRWNSIER